MSVKEVLYVETMSYKVDVKLKKAIEKKARKIGVSVAQFQRIVLSVATGEETLAVAMERVSQI